MRYVALTVALAALVGCAAPPPKPVEPPKPPAVATTNPPQCLTKVECEQMWVKAQEAIQTVTRMRLRLVGDTRLETFATTSADRLTGVVLKYPIGTDAYELRASVECKRNTPCKDIPVTAVDLFNMLVGGPAVKKQ